MQHTKTATVLIVLIAIVALMATSVGIFFSNGTAPYQYTSIRGQQVLVYGKGLYKHMSAEVAPQGIAQDYITLFVGIPLLVLAGGLARRGSIKARLLLAGVVAYFLVTYLFYLVMAMYNSLFLAYVFLAGTSFYLLLITLLSFNRQRLPMHFTVKAPVVATGRFLLFTSGAIALLWLGTVVPPLLDGSVTPIAVEHYTTLVVQGLDLAILLPGAWVVAILFMRKKSLGYLLSPVYFVFLSILMTALTAKVVAMGILGFPVIPVVFIIPTFNVFTIICTVAIFRQVKDNPMEKRTEPVTNHGYIVPS